MASRRLARSRAGLHWSAVGRQSEPHRTATARHMRRTWPSWPRRAALIPGGSAAAQHTRSGPMAQARRMTRQQSRTFRSEGPWPGPARRPLLLRVSRRRPDQSQPAGREATAVRHCLRCNIRRWCHERSEGRREPARPRCGADIGGRRTAELRWWRTKWTAARPCPRPLRTPRHEGRAAPPTAPQLE